MSERALAQGGKMFSLGRVPGVAFVLVALFGLFASTSGNFFTAANVSNILVQSSIAVY